MSYESMTFASVGGPESADALFKLYEALGKAQADFPPLPRTATGIIGNGRKFQYAPFHKVMECIKPTLVANGIALTQVLHTPDPDKDIVALTLIVSGHGAALSSTLTFARNSNIKDFGADVTYNKRYQLTSFFCLEGDPDADDYEKDTADKGSAPQNQASKEIGKEPSASPGKSVSNGSNGAAKSQPANGGEPKAAAAVGGSPNGGDRRPAKEKLTDVMKQLGWGMKDFDVFCERHSDEFPDFVSAAKLSPEKQELLYQLIVKEEGIAPF